MKEATPESPAGVSASERPATRMWREALAQLEELLQQPEDQRQRSLDELARTQPQLHSMLVSLLSAEARAESQGFLEPATVRGELLKENSTLGPWRILSRLGAGGMGEVWLADRIDGLYEGEVAIKTLHPYFGGGALRARFLREARILGRLAHPNIARLLDAGVADDGSVYLVLEYVRGVAIDAWCDDHKLDVVQRLRLFMEVCAAVSHAHVNLIVHRDLKPSNILVTEEGHVKLLDFGVAKLVQDDAAADRTELTRLTGRIFTPEYAAPEQILGEPITTVADVYSLGVLLHVLLTGTRPYARDSNLVEIERAVLHEEPLRPSRAVAGNADAGHIASNRSSTAARLQRSLAGDLDVIAAHALRKSPAERYPSVLALSEDVRRHLQHEPILARRENLLARARKFVRRHRVGVAASVFVALVIAAGVAGVLWQAQLARAEARKAGAIRDFLVGIFERNSVAHPEGAKARQTTAEELLAQSSREIRTGLGDAPEVRTELLGVMAQLYSMMEMQKEAIPLLQERLAGQRAVLGESHVEVARTLSDLSNSQFHNLENEDARRSATESIEMFDAHGEESAIEYARAHMVLARSMYATGTSQDGSAGRLIDKGLELATTYHPTSELRLEMLGAVSLARYNEMNFDEALEYSAEAARLVETSAVEADGIQRATVYHAHGGNLHWVSRNDEAERFLRKAFDEAERAGGPAHPLALDAQRELGALLGWLGQREEAKALLARTLVAQERAQHQRLASAARMDLSRVLLMRGEYAQAEGELHDVVEMWASKGMPTFGPRAHLARIYTEQGRFDLAARNLQDSEGNVVKANGKGTWWHAVVVNRLGALHLARGDLTQARGCFARNPEAERRPGDLSPNGAYAQVGLVRIAILQRDPGATQAARVLLERVIASSWRTEIPDEEAAAHMLLGVAFVNEGKVQEAQAHLARAVEMRERMDAAESPLLAEARLYLAQQEHLAGDGAAARTSMDAAARGLQMQEYVGPQYRELLGRTQKMLARKTRA